MKTFKELKDIHMKLKSNYPEIKDNNLTRFHRALSWLNKSEQEKDPDAQFIFLWISLNSAYMTRNNKSVIPSDESSRYKFFKLLLKYSNKEIQHIIWQRFSNEIRGILNNKFILNTFWQDKEEHWGRKLKIEKKEVHKALTDEEDTIYILETLFKRLYVLRNQIFHGGATWGGRINRDQVNDGARLMSHLVPLFIDIMMQNPSQNWGVLAYPPPKQEKDQVLLKAQNLSKK